jgi:hypothetical protein
MMTLGVLDFQRRTGSTRLAGVLLLGYLSRSNEDIKRILGSVSMKTTVVEDPSWRCRHWVWDALAVSLGFDCKDELPLMTSQCLVR